MRYQLYKADTEDSNNTFFLQDQNSSWWSWGTWLRWEEKILITRIAGVKTGWCKRFFVPSWIQQKLHPVSRLQFLVETGHHIKGNDIPEPNVE